jgi:hypothetical protein
LEDALPDLPLTLRTRPLKMARLVLISGVFVAMGIWLLPRAHLVALSCIIFFGLCAVVGLVNLHPKASYLTLTDQGFLFVSLFRKHFVSWSSIQSFVPVPVAVQVQQMVGWNYSPGFQKSQRVRRFSTAMTGVEAGLPDTYGMGASELADLMNQCREKYGGAEPAVLK